MTILQNSQKGPLCGLCPFGRSGMTSLIPFQGPGSASPLSSSGSGGSFARRAPDSFGVQGHAKQSYKKSIKTLYQSFERSQSNHRFPYGYLVTTSPQLLIIS